MAKVSMSQITEEKILHKVSIHDTLGNEVTVGSIIAYQSSYAINFGVYEGIIETTRSTSTKSYVKSSYRIQICKKYKSKIRRTVIGQVNFNNEYIEDKSIMLVRDPLFELQAQSIRECLDVQTRLMDDGSLPKDTKII